MTITIARYALWILLCIPVAILGFSLFGDLLEGVLQESRSKKEKKDALQRKEDKRKAFEDEYRRRHGSGF